MRTSGLLVLYVFLGLLFSRGGFGRSEDEGEMNRSLFTVTVLVMMGLAMAFLLGIAILSMFFDVRIGT